MARLRCARPSGALPAGSFFQDSAAAPGATARWEVIAALSYEGVLYFPTQDLSLTGSGSDSSTMDGDRSQSHPVPCAEQSSFDAMSGSRGIRGEADNLRVMSMGMFNATVAIE